MLSEFHSFASSRVYCFCPCGKREIAVGLAIPPSHACSSTPALQSIAWRSTGAGNRRSCSLCSPSQIWSTHNQPGAVQKPLTCSAIAYQRLPVPLPRQALKQHSLQCSVSLALRSSAKHQASSHPFQVFEGTSVLLHETVQVQHKATQTVLSPNLHSVHTLPGPNQHPVQRSLPPKPCAFASLEETSAPAHSGLPPFSCLAPPKTEVTTCFLERTEIWLQT